MRADEYKKKHDDALKKAGITLGSSIFIILPDNFLEANPALFKKLRAVAPDLDKNIILYKDAKNKVFVGMAKYAGITHTARPITIWMWPWVMENVFDLKSISAKDFKTETGKKIVLGDVCLRSYEDEKILKNTILYECGADILLEAPIPTDEIMYKFYCVWGMKSIKLSRAEKTPIRKFFNQHDF